MLAVNRASHPYASLIVFSSHWLMSFHASNQAVYRRSFSVFLLLLFVTSVIITLFRVSQNVSGKSRYCKMLESVVCDVCVQRSCTGCGRKKWTPKFFRRFLSYCLGF